MVARFVNNPHTAAAKLFDQVIAFFKERKLGSLACKRFGFNFDRRTRHEIGGLVRSTRQSVHAIAKRGRTVLIQKRSPFERLTIHRGMIDVIDLLAVFRSREYECVMLALSWARLMNFDLH